MEYNNMELEEGELMDDAAAAGPPGTEAEPHNPVCLLCFFLTVSYCDMGQPLLSMTMVLDGLYFIYGF